MNGQIVGRGETLNHDCPGIPYTLLLPAGTAENIAVCARNLARWTARLAEYWLFESQGKVSTELPPRAKFATDVLRTVQANISIGVCCNLVAVDPDEDILGLATYFIVPSKLDARRLIGLISLVAIDPANLPGSPTNVQMRGVGTALVAAIAQRMKVGGAQGIYLHPLDSAADRFWRGRGFRDCRENALCVEGTSAIQSLIDACAVGEDSQGDVVLCGHKERR